MIYNDTYSESAGHRHPQREGWAEIADFNDNVMKVGLAGQTLSYRDQELTLHRNGYPEQVWLGLAYSPVPDESGHPAGVIAIVVRLPSVLWPNAGTRKNLNAFKTCSNKPRRLWP